MSTDPVTVGEGFAFFAWHRLNWPSFKCLGNGWCFECTKAWRRGPR